MKGIRIQQQHLHNHYNPRNVTMKIAKSSDEQSQRSWSERSLGDRDQKLFQFNDASEQTNFGINPKGEMEDLVEFFELY